MGNFIDFFSLFALIFKKIPFIFVSSLDKIYIFPYSFPIDIDKVLSFFFWYKKDNSDKIRKKIQI